MIGLLANALMGIQWWIQVMNLVDANPISPSLVARMLVKAQTEELYEMHEFRNFNFPLGDYEKKQPYSQQECRQSCLHSGNTCWMKRLPLGNGRQVAVSDEHFVYIKTRLSSDFYPAAANRELPLLPIPRKKIELSQFFCDHFIPCLYQY